jgi:hypothetical protein
VVRLRRGPPPSAPALAGPLQESYNQGMNRVAVLLLAVLLALLLAAPAFAEEQPGRGWGLEFAIGTQGILSFEEVGVRLPMIGQGFFIGLKARLLSSLTWATFINMDTGEQVSFHPDVVGGVISFGGCSPMLFGVLRMYGESDILLGYSFTPWDSAIYGTGNLIGDNFTFAILGCFGFELFTAGSMAVFLDAGGGFKSLLGDKGNPYAVASSWLGSGFGIKMGMRFYL